MCDECAATAARLAALERGFQLVSNEMISRSEPAKRRSILDNLNAHRSFLQTYGEKEAAEVIWKIVREFSVEPFEAPKSTTVGWTANLSSLLEKGRTLLKRRISGPASQ